MIVAGAGRPRPKVLAEIAAGLSKLPRPTRVIEPSYTIEPVQDGEREVTLRRVGGEQDLYATYHVPSIASPELPAFEIIATALGDQSNGRLHKRLVEPGKGDPRALAWCCAPRRSGADSCVGAVLKKDDDLAAARKIFLETIESLKTEPITADELKRTQLQLDKDFDQTLADPQRLCLALSETIAGGDWRLLFLLRDRIDAITLDQVNAAAATWIKPSNRNLPAGPVRPDRRARSHAAGHAQSTPSRRGPAASRAPRSAPAKPSTPARRAWTSAARSSPRCPAA